MKPFFLKKSIARASIMLAFFSFAAKLTGLLRDRILASQFGAGTHLDVYYSAFKLPDLIMNLIIFGAVSSAFIPVFLEAFKREEKSAWRVAQNFVNVAFVSVVAASAVMAIFARPLASLIAPGFSGADQALLVQLLRLMLLSPVIFSLSTIMGSILQALERFVVYAIAPILYNLGIIIGALYLVPIMRSHGYPEVLGLGYGVVLGALMHLAIQFPSAYHAGFRFKAIFDLADEQFRKIVWLMIPRTIGIGASSFETIVINAFASLLGSGSITVLTFASNLQFVPITVLGISVATAVFPQLAAHGSQDETAAFRSKLRSALRQASFWVGLTAVVVFIFRELVIRIIFQSGAFKGADVHATATLLGIFMFGVVAQSLVPIMSRAFYAMQNTRTPMVVTFLSIALNIGLGYLFTFVFGWGVKGLATSYVIAGNVNFLLLYLNFRRMYGN